MPADSQGQRFAHRWVVIHDQNPGAFFLFPAHGFLLTSAHVTTVPVGSAGSMVRVAPMITARLRMTRSPRPSQTCRSASAAISPSVSTATGRIPRTTSMFTGRNILILPEVATISECGLEKPQWSAVSSPS